jgi:hypothetical protein
MVAVDRDQRVTGVPFSAQAEVLLVTGARVPGRRKL